MSGNKPSTTRGKSINTATRGRTPAKARPTPRRPAAGRRRPAQRRRRLWVIGLLAAVALAVGGWIVSRPGGEAASGVAPFVGGDLHSMVVDPSDPARLWVGGHGGAAASTDGGRTWTQVASLAGADPMGWEIDPKDPSRHYLGGHPGFQVSTDGGRTFTMRNQGLPATDVHGLGHDPASGRLYAAVVGRGLLGGSGPALGVAGRRLDAGHALVERVEQTRIGELALIADAVAELGGGLGQRHIHHPAAV